MDKDASKPVTAQHVKLSGKTKKMIFPRDVNLTADDRTVHSFKMGVQEVPVELADHQYLVANGVTDYSKAGEAELQDKLAAERAANPGVGGGGTAQNEDALSHALHGEREDGSDDSPAGGKEKQARPEPNRRK